MYIKGLTKTDLFIAYKKVKFELFNDKNSIATIDLFSYENALHTNINKLFKDIKENGLQNISCSEYYEVPKSLNIDEVQDDNDVHFHSSSLKHHKLKKAELKKSTLAFRKVINANINFHIVSALWIAKIGQYIDAKFGKNIYGSRLTRIKPMDSSSCEYNVKNQDYNLDSPRIFESYQHNFQSWRNNSFKSIRALHETSSVIAITMDITKFFHSIDLEYFVTKKFYEDFNLNSLFKENPSLKKFHKDFIKKLDEWNNAISEKSDKSDGVPIGLSASYILANAAMHEFDKIVEKNLAPTYYGRYVDDILLVFPDNGNIKTGDDVIKYLLSKKVIEEKQIETDTGTETDLYYKYFKLKKSKQRIFYLDKGADLSIIDGLENEINSVSSEWRFMPDIGNENSSLLEKIIGFYADGEEFHDALRKIDASTIKRLGLSLLITHSHSLNQYINPKEWKTQRHKIYDLIENHIFISKNFFSNFTFIPKIFRLMVHSGDGERAYCFLENVFKRINRFKKKQKYLTLEESNGKSIMYHKFVTYSINLLQEVFIESFTITNEMSTKFSKKIIDLLFCPNVLCEQKSNLLINFLNTNTSKSQNESFNFEIHDTLDQKNIQVINSYLFLRDLSFNGYASSATEYRLTQDENSLFNKITKQYRIGEQFDRDIHSDKTGHSIFFINEFNIQLIDNNQSNMPLVFPTKLFSAADISIVNSLTNYHEKFKYFVNYLRGNHSYIEDTEKPPSNTEELLPIDGEQISIIEIKNNHLNEAEKINIAITNFKVHDKYWENSVIQKPVKSLDRYNQLSKIIKEAVKKKPDYLVLPELAIPQEWAWLISKKLLSNNISLITGVEYIHEKIENRKVVHNSIMKFLVSDDLGFNYMRFQRQDKTHGAHGETTYLGTVAGIELKPHDDYKDKHIYKHGNFYFSSLICNELTDINNRAKFRGKIDALFTIEWNKDIKSFNALVESASLDIHSYVIQVNNRQYGDSRIRAPFSDDYKRDIVQVRGGKHDYLIVGEIDISKLRKFQSHNVSPLYPFKPTPTGYEILPERKLWGDK